MLSFIFPLPFINPIHTASLRNRSVDHSKALAIEGVRDFVSAKDIPGENQFGFLGSDDRELIAKNEVNYSQSHFILDF